MSCLCRARLAGLVGVLWLSCCTLLAPARAQTAAAPWSVLSPAPGAVVASGELFFLAELPDSIALDARTVRLLLDERDLTAQARWKARSVSLLLTEPLERGPHRIRVEADAEGGPLPALEWTFDVAGGTAALPGGLRLRGSAGWEGRNTSLTGPGTFLRQEPPYRYAGWADLEARYGAVRFPVRIYATTDETGAAQPRSRVQVGAVWTHAALWAGDNTPYYDRLALAGARSRGVQAELGWPWLKLHGTYGVLQRRLDVVIPGERPDPEAEPEGDPAELVRITPERRMGALRLAIGPPRRVQWSLYGMKASDEVPALLREDRDRVLGRPAENVVAGSDLRVRLLRERLQLDGGAALSILTEDISRGVATKARIDSVFDVNLPVDPADLEWLIVLNTTTVPLRVDELNSLAWYVDGRFDVRGHTLTASYQSVGSAFYSFGNPFLRNDRHTLTLGERFRALGGRLTGTLRYQRYGTLSGAADGVPTLDAQAASVSLVAFPHPRGPRLFGSARFNARDRGLEGEGLSEVRTRSLSVGAMQRLETGVLAHDLSLFVTHAGRDDALRPGTGNTTLSISGSLQEEFPFPLVVALQATRLEVEQEDGLALQRLTSLGLRAGYTFERPRLTVSAGARNAHTAATAFSGVSDRLTTYAGGTLMLPYDMTLALRVGLTRYREAGGPDYDEAYLSLRHQIRL